MKLEEHHIINLSGEYSRKVWYLPGISPAQKICLFLDGEYYVKHMDAPALLTDLQDKKLIPPVACLFVSHVNGAARHDDFTCNPRYARFVVEDLMPWIREHSKVTELRDHLIGGVSLSGLEAAYIALSYPSTFAYTLCQSGSLWWNKEWLTSRQTEFPLARGKYWISVGNKETDSGVSHPPTNLRQDVDQITACRRFAEALEKKSIPVRYHLYEGGHDPRAWRAELSDALQWLLA